MHTELLRHSSGTLKITGAGSGEFIHKDVVWVAPTTPGQTFQVRTPRGELKLAGSLVFTADRTGMLSVVNAVPAETVVKGVVPSEVYTSAPMESLKAQAVAARGEVLSYLGVRHLADPYGLCSKVHCQVYSGLARENPRTNQAVDATRGEVMFESSSLGGDWRVVDARYSSSCGGHTEHNDLVWGSEPEPYLRGRFDLKGAAASPWSKGITDQNIDAWLSPNVQAWCNTASYGGKRTFRWDKQVDAVTVQEKLEHHKNIGLLKDVKILARGVSGRVIKMQFLGTSGEYELDRELAIRRIFGGLRSSMFTMTIDRDDKGRPSKFKFRGGGYGHGSGMCQTGAMAMGGAGRNYKQILTHYYKNITMKKLY
jgi:stage II sporulation protein D